MSSKDPNRWLRRAPAISFISFCMVYVVGWVGKNSGGDRLGTAILAFPFIVLTFLSAVAAIVMVFVRSRTVSGRLKLWASAPAVWLVSFFLVTKYGPPKTTIYLEYRGNRPEMRIDITSHFGAEGGSYNSGEGRKISTGTGLRHVDVQWRQDFNTPQQEKHFDLRDQIPNFGKNRDIYVLVTDSNATCEVRPARNP